jgi:hypothetical protein
VRAHLELRADDLARSGMTRAAAERQARVETIARDARLAVHQLQKLPSFAITAVVTLAMAIAANAVVFSAINGFILRPLGRLPATADQHRRIYGAVSAIS